MTPSHITGQSTNVPGGENLYSGIRREIPRSDGIYIEGDVNSVKVIFTADTGASCTIISDRVYNRIPENERPKLTKCTSIVGASGHSLNELGKAKFQIKLGPLSLYEDMIVAEIADEVLLGIDILQHNNKGAADILVSENVIKLGGESIPCFQIGRPGTVRRVKSADCYQVPGYSEAIIDVYVERKVSDDYLPKMDMLIEPTDNFSKEYSLAMARSLVDLKYNVTGKVRIMNPSPTPQCINQDAVLGTAEIIDTDIAVIEKHETNQEGEAETAVKRIKLENEKCDQGSTEATVQEDIHFENQADVTSDPAPQLPEHLKELYIKAAEGKNSHQKQIIASTLIECAEAFSVDENDIGLTHLAQHVIDTGDARPIKQRPRRVPLAFADAEEQAINDLKEKGVIRESTSAWGSPIVLVSRLTGKFAHVSIIAY